MKEPENRTSEIDIQEKQVPYPTLKERSQGPLMLGGVGSLGFFVAGAIFKTFTQEPTFSEYPTNLSLNGVLLGKQVDLVLNVDLFLRNGISEVIPYALAVGAAIVVKTFLDEDQRYRTYLHSLKPKSQSFRDPVLVRAQEILDDIRIRQTKLRQDLGLTSYNLTS